MDNAANANLYVPQAVVADFQGLVQQLYRNAMSIDFLLHNPDIEQVSYTPTEAEILESVQLMESERGSYSKEDDSVAHRPSLFGMLHRCLQSSRTFWLQQETGEEFPGMIQKMQDQVGNLQQNS
ncbi:unnamed protein product [Hyaloperonospora brassicae]|uniref:Uncharacterized protein n=1 Tax=Hyaloperonospora brassicae TaxID=162125 RepID=A0AAV0UN25_HYABA|nr:unnamed protein product [Hyaloperonospora brassicae]